MQQGASGKYSLAVTHVLGDRLPTGKGPITPMLHGNNGPPSPEPGSAGEMPEQINKENRNAMKRNHSLSLRPGDHFPEMASQRGRELVSSPGGLPSPCHRQWPVLSAVPSGGRLLNGQLTQLTTPQSLGVLAAHSQLLLEPRAGGARGQPSSLTEKRDQVAVGGELC